MIKNDYKKIVLKEKRKFDKILDIYEDKNFTEICGKIGRSTIVSRVYKDGTICEK